MGKEAWGHCWTYMFTEVRATQRPYVLSQSCRGRAHLTVQAPQRTPPTKRLGVRSASDAMTICFVTVLSRTGSLIGPGSAKDSAHKEAWGHCWTYFLQKCERRNDHMFCHSSVADGLNYRCRLRKGLRPQRGLWSLRSWTCGPSFGLDCNGFQKKNQILA